MSEPSRHEHECGAPLKTDCDGWCRMKAKAYLEGIQAINERFRAALHEIAAYDSGDGCCQFGCDTPSIAAKALNCS